MPATDDASAYQTDPNNHGSIFSVTAGIVKPLDRARPVCHYSCLVSDPAPEAAVPSGTDADEARARAALAPDVYDYFAAGSGVEESLPASVAAWRRLSFYPRILRDVSSVDTSTSILGSQVSTPIGVAPTGYTRMAHADGELAMAAGAAAAGSVYTMSTRATSTAADIGKVAGAWWLQVYLLRDRELTAGLVARSVDAGASALVLTADTPYVAAKARDTAALGELGEPLLAELDGRRDTGVFQAPTVTFADIGWLREISGGLPVVVKGVLRADDARACLDAGASAVWVSNHGGRQLDGAVPPATALPDVVRAVGDRAEVYVDGGIRTGRDVLRALALGARGVFLGRPLLWALATGGQAGVRGALARFTAEFEEAMALSGCPAIPDIGADLVSPT